MRVVSVCLLHLDSGRVAGIQSSMQTTLLATHLLASPHRMEVFQIMKQHGIHSIMTAYSFVFATHLLLFVIYAPGAWAREEQAVFSFFYVYSLVGKLRRIDMIYLIKCFLISSDAHTSLTRIKVG